MVLNLPLRFNGGCEVGKREVAYMLSPPCIQSNNVHIPFARLGDSANIVAPAHCVCHQMVNDKRRPTVNLNKLATAYGSANAVGRTDNALRSSKLGEETQRRRPAMVSAVLNVWCLGNFRSRCARRSL
jgi:hypothetical protein